MTKDELKSKFDMLYNYMSVSNEPKYMMLFGDVMKHMMAWYIENKPDVAEQYIETLCAIKWRQYLSRTEAMEVFNGMEPAGAWSYDVWYKAMQDLGQEIERDTVFNSYALWITMNAIHSDNGNVITSLMGLATTDVTNPDYIRAVHSMAINKLLDKDKKFCVRCYFLGHH